LFAHSGDRFGTITVEGGETNAVVRLASRARLAREAAPRRSLEGQPLPELAAVGLDSSALPNGRLGLLCIVDAEQRLSRRVLRLLNDQAETLKQKGVALAIVQTAPLTEDAWADLKRSLNPEAVAIGRVSLRSPANRWVTEATPLPWLILVNLQGRVAAEGFTLDELEAKLEALGGR
jgi:hypothetical protein